MQDPIQNMCEYADPGNQWWRAQEIRFLLLVKETEIEFLVLALALAQPPCSVTFGERTRGRHVLT